MVVVHVRDQHPVDRPRVSGRRHVAAQVRDAGPQDRVGQDARAGDVAEDGGVPEPGDPSHVVLAT